MLKPIWIVVNVVTGMNRPPGYPTDFPMPSMGQLSSEMQRPSVSALAKPGGGDYPSAYWSEEECNKYLATLLAQRTGTYSYQVDTFCMRATIEK